jgi:hypothetical protein
LRNFLLVILVSVIILAIANLLGIVSYFCAILGSSIALYTVIAVLTVTISIALYSHIDTIIKDIPEELKEQREELYDIAIDSLTLLKKESLSNIPLAIVILVAYFLVTNSGIFVCSSNILAANFNLLITLISSIFFVYIISDLVRAFLTASEYRSIIKKG